MTDNSKSTLTAFIVITGLAIGWQSYDTVYVHRELLRHEMEIHEIHKRIERTAQMLLDEIKRIEAVE